MSPTSGLALLSSFCHSQVHASVLVCPSCGLPGPPNKMRCDLRIPARDAWRHAHTPAHQEETDSKERNGTPDHRSIQRSTVLARSKKSFVIGNRLWTGQMGYGALSPALDTHRRVPLRPTYLCFGENGEDLQQFCRLITSVCIY
jgi:hypothetical protein